MKLQTILLVMVIALVTQGCSRPSTPYDLPYKAPKNAPPEYRLGWEHGCKSGFVAYGNAYYKSLYDFTQDVEKMKNLTYSRAWTDSYHYCRAYVNRLLAGYSFRKRKDGDAPAVFSNSRINFLRPTEDTRDDAVIKKKGLGFGIFDGVDSPGWGSQAWGSDVSCQQDWLGATSKDCGGWGGRRGSESSAQPSIGSFLGY